MYMVQSVLSRSLAVIAVSSHYSLCWGDRDIDLVVSNFRVWLEKHSLSGLPVYAVGNPPSLSK
jgi:hypothetical protein